jgi:hypothetical protein
MDNIRRNRNPFTKCTRKDSKSTLNLNGFQTSQGASDAGTTASFATSKANTANAAARANSEQEATEHQVEKGSIQFYTTFTFSDGSTRKVLMDVLARLVTSEKMSSTYFIDFQTFQNALQDPRLRELVLSLFSIYCLNKEADPEILDDQCPAGASSVLVRRPYVALLRGNHSNSRLGFARDILDYWVWRAAISRNIGRSMALPVFTYKGPANAYDEKQDCCHSIPTFPKRR